MCATSSTRWARLRSSGIILAVRTCFDDSLTAGPRPVGQRRPSNAPHGPQLLRRRVGSVREVFMRRARRALAVTRAAGADEADRFNSRPCLSRSHSNTTSVPTELGRCGPAPALDQPVSCLAGLAPDGFPCSAAVRAGVSHGVVVPATRPRPPAVKPPRITSRCGQHGRLSRACRRAGE